MQRSAKMTPASSSQNHVLPGGSSTPFISSRMRKPFIGRHLRRPSSGVRCPARVARSSSLGDAAGPVVEGLAVAALGLVAAHHSQQGVGDLVDGPGVLDPVDEGGVGAERAAEADVDGLDDVVAHVRGVAPEADVGDLGLGARRRAAREVHADDAGVVAPAPVRSPSASADAGRRPAGRRASGPRSTARSLVSTTAKRQNSLPVQATTPRSKGPGNGEYFWSSSSSSSASTSVLGHAGEDEVLVGAEADRAVAVGLGQPGGLDQLDARHAADRDRAPDVDEPVAGAGGARRRGRRGSGG